METHHECPLAVMRSTKQITEQEYSAGVKWRGVYLSYLRTIGAPTPYGGSIDSVSDADCGLAAYAHRRGMAILMAKGRRVMHATNAVAVYEESQELGDWSFTSRAAKVGLKALAIQF